MSGWPYPERPGVPLEEGKRGVHWVGGNAMLWVPFDVSGGWRLHGAGGGYMTAEWASRLPYEGPCLRPGDVASRELLAGFAAFDQVLAWINTQTEQTIDKGDLYKAVMEMRPSPSGTTAWVKGMREAARIAEMRRSYGHAASREKIVEGIASAIRNAADRMEGS